MAIFPTLGIGSISARSRERRRNLRGHRAPILNRTCALAASALLTWASLAGAEGGVVRSVLPDGRVVYGTAPAEGAKTSAPLPIPVQEGLTSGVTKAQGEALDKRLAAKNKALAAAGEKRARAWDRLLAAKDARAKLNQPSPNDRRGPGRLLAADAAIEAAQKAYDQASEEYRRAM